MVLQPCRDTEVDTTAHVTHPYNWIASAAILEFTLQQLQILSLFLSQRKSVLVRKNESRHR